MASVSDACMKCTDCTLLHFVEMTCVPAMRLKALLSLKIDIDLGALGLELPQQMPMKDANEGCIPPNADYYSSKSCKHGLPKPSPVNDVPVSFLC